MPFSKGPILAPEIIAIMEDRIVLKKMVFSTVVGLLFFVTAMFTTMLDLSFVWRNIWLGFCLVFFCVGGGWRFYPLRGSQFRT